MLIQNNLAWLSHTRNPKLGSRAGRSPAPVSRWNAYFEFSGSFSALAAANTLVRAWPNYAFTQHLGTGQWDNDCLGTTRLALLP